jgi:hypothetical protein
MDDRQTGLQVSGPQAVVLVGDLADLARLANEEHRQCEAALQSGLSHAQSAGGSGPQAATSEGATCTGSPTPEAHDSGRGSAAMSKEGYTSRQPDEPCPICGVVIRGHPRCLACRILIGPGHYERTTWDCLCTRCLSAGAGSAAVREQCIELVAAVIEELIVDMRINWRRPEAHEANLHALSRRIAAWQYAVEDPTLDWWLDTVNIDRKSGREGILGRGGPFWDYHDGLSALATLRVRHHWQLSQAIERGIHAEPA